MGTVALRALWGLDSERLYAEKTTWFRKFRDFFFHVVWCDTYDFVTGQDFQKHDQSDAVAEVFVKVLYSAPFLR